MDMLDGRWCEDYADCKSCVVHIVQCIYKLILMQEGCTVASECYSISSQHQFYLIQME